MATLSVYFGESYVSALFYVSKADYKFGSYPYSFLHSLVGHHFNEDKFQKQVIRLISKNLQIDLAGCKQIIGNYRDNLSELLSALNVIDSCSWALCENFSVILPQTFVSNFPIEKDPVLSKPEAINYFSNLDLYSNVAPVNTDTIKIHDYLLKKLFGQALSLQSFDLSKPILLSGSRFARYDKSLIDTYMLALDVLILPGFYQLNLDLNNKLPAIALLNKQFAQGSEGVSTISNVGLDLQNDEIFTKEFVTVGTIFSSSGKVECLFESEEGNSQFVEIGPNKIFVFLLAKDDSARVVIDNKHTGHVETEVVGGSLGFVIDTREKPALKISPAWEEVIKERLHNF